jgi:serine/threonine protein kinase
MQYPLIAEYVEAIRFAEDNFDTLKDLRPELDTTGNPIMSSGNFAVVFLMRSIKDHKKYALKCFTREQENRDYYYEETLIELHERSSPYLLYTRYFKDELRVYQYSGNSNKYSVLLMEWVDGLPLDLYVKTHLKNRYRLIMLAYQFCQMGVWLVTKHFAHGDIEPKNILVKEDGSLMLIDYDNMYFSTFDKMKTSEIGNPDYLLPSRSKDKWDIYMDFFATASIALSLTAIASKPELYTLYAGPNRLLLNSLDYSSLADSKAMKDIKSLFSNNSILPKIHSAFQLAFSGMYEDFCAWWQIIASLQINCFNNLDSEFYIDSDGVVYSRDRHTLLYYSRYLKLKVYHMEFLCTTIAPRAFEYNLELPHISDSETAPYILSLFDPLEDLDGNELEVIFMPSSIESIGDDALIACKNLRKIYCIGKDDSKIREALSKQRFKSNLLKMLSLIDPDDIPLFKEYGDIV